VLRIVEFGPGYASPRHRTLSIDYLFVLSGELELELDKGTLVRLYQGDIVVGVIRARTRRAGSWCR
jgi:quercetin dioxygenase-like cupin family protein